MRRRRQVSQLPRRWHSASFFARGLCLVKPHPPFLFLKMPMVMILILILLVKGKFLPAPNSSHRKATFVGGRLHFDVFSSSVVSISGCKYLLVIVDEFSGYVWAYGMKKKSETMMIVQKVVMMLEKKMRRQTDELCFYDHGVSGLRCDNAGENVLKAM